MDQSVPTGRLAPSPTGAQHVGNARTYLIAWLSIRSRGGRLLLRIEDIDSPRTRPGAADDILRDLEWLGLDWDAEPTLQTHCLHRHQHVLERLKQREMVYPCTCSRKDIERAASAPHAEDDHEGPAYPGTCAGRHARDASSLVGRAFAWRFRLPPATPAFSDGFARNVQLDLHKLGGDFVVWKSAGPPAYQLAVVADDADMGITEVVRGDDLLPSTPRQLLLYEALEVPPPAFFHVPLVVGPDGRRLAKRHGDTRLSTLRRADVRPEILVGLLAWSCGWLSNVEPITPRELLPFFQWATIPHRPFIFTDKLLRGLLESGGGFTSSFAS
jgi:glutamyl-tRNA synthetase